MSIIRLRNADIILCSLHKMPVPFGVRTRASLIGVAKSVR